MHLRRYQGLLNNIAGVEKLCTGCKACYNGCPINAIEMKKNKNGFTYPSVKESCINCGKCVKICPALHDIVRKEKTEIDSFAALNVDKEEIKLSSSGGIFLKTAKYVINELSGVVFGTVYTDELKVRVQKADKEAELYKMAGSKYVYSDVGTTYREVEKELKAGRVVLFSGVSCQIAGLYHYLGKEYSKLISLEVLCHGAPSQDLFDKYLHHMQRKHKNKIISINQRDKSKPWNPLITKLIRIDFENKTMVRSEDFDPYMSFYIREFAYRDACYECKYVGANRTGDLVLGDFGGLGIMEKCSLKVDDGVSLLLINTKKGRELLDQIEGIQMEKRNLNEVIKLNSCLRSHVKKPAVTESFVKDYAILSEDELFDKYYYKNYSYRIRAVVKKLAFTFVGCDNIAKILLRK